MRGTGRLSFWISDERDWLEVGAGPAACRADAFRTFEDGAIEIDAGDAATRLWLRYFD